MNIDDPAAMTKFFSSSFGRILLVTLFFSFIIFLLRFLYGPKGFLRDPEWDKWNEDSCREEKNLKIKKEHQSVFEQEKNFFLSYVRKFYRNIQEQDLHIRLKEEHSLAVFKFAGMIQSSEVAFSDKDSATVLLAAALYHDLGRFEQYQNYATFSDAHSINHGVLGAKILGRAVKKEVAKENNLPAFLSSIPQELHSKIRAVVCMHNRISIPEHLPSDIELPLKAVRDADKLDILRILQKELGPGSKPDETVVFGLIDDAETYTKEVLDDVLAGKTVNYTSMRYCNDFRLSACAWVNDLWFDSSRQRLKQLGYLDPIMQALPENESMQALRKYIHSRLS